MMSYDPSSLNRNKTLLEAIEEVKKFLIANPCYKVFYANTNYVIGTTTYSKTYIDDPDSMAEYDVVFFDNNYYGKVESVGDSTFTIIGATNFKGDTGAQGIPGTPGTPGADGQDGTDGTDGVSITNVSIDASNHLICTLSNGTTIDAGEIPGGSTRIISLVSGLSGTLTQDEYDKLVANDFNYVIEMGGNFYHKASIYGGGLNAHYTCIRKVSSVETWASDINIDSTRAWTLSTNVLRTKIQNGQIDSGAASNGQVLIADGTGGAAWQTPSGGTTLNHYRYSGSGLNTIYSICKNTKGKVLIEYTGSGGISEHTPLSISFDSGSTPNCVSLSGLSTGTVASPSMKLYYFQITQYGVLNFGISSNISAGTNSNITSPSFVVEYYNDTQLHS